MFSPSYAIPPVSAPSPMTAATLPCLPCSLMALAIPYAAEMDVLLCPEMNASACDSLRLVNPEIPPLLRSVLNWS